MGLRNATTVLKGLDASALVNKEWVNEAWDAEASRKFFSSVYLWLSYRTTK